MSDATQLQRNLRMDVEALPPRRSRLHAPTVIDAADKLIADRFSSHGWEARLLPFSYERVSGYDDRGTLRNGSWGPVEYDRVEGTNVLGVRKGRQSGETVVVLAHHDTPRDLPGADDNAAGVAVLLELARILGGTAFAKTVLLAAVDMEEIGMFGSRALVEEWSRESSISAAITFDTVAYTSTAPGSQMLPPGLGILYPRLVRRLRRAGMRGDWTGIIYRGFSGRLARGLGDALAKQVGKDRVVLLRDPGDLPLVGPVLRATLPMVRQFARSDHLSFWNAGIPAVVVTDTTFFRNPHYHELTDTPETLDYERLEAITLATADAVVSLAGGD